MTQPRLILASNSPRRRQMLAWTGWAFETDAADLNEDPLPGEPPGEYVSRLAGEKARTVAQRYAGEPVFILAADTTVADGPDLLGKPANAHEARSMLRRLRGRTHQVYTALALMDVQNAVLMQDLCVCQVSMRPYSDAEIEDYIQSGDPFDKAGGYAIQHADFLPVVDFGGCFASVMGLPLCHLQRIAARVNVVPPQNVPRNCQNNLNYSCPIWQAVLNGETVG